ncbi:UNVERIFIED_CONTAM: hypothetical protein FKN15_056440 [Acipenser sinensis]
MGQQRPDGRTERGWKRAAQINIDTQSGEKKRQTPSDKDSEGTGLSPQPGSPALCFTLAFPASVTRYFPQHGHPNA